MQDRRLRAALKYQAAFADYSNTVEKHRQLDTAGGAANRKIVDIAAAINRG